MDMPGAHRLEYRLTMGPDLVCVPRVIDWVMKASAPMFSEAQQLYVRGALYELLFNAIEHGSLEVYSDDKRQALDEGRYDALLEERRNDPRFRDRKVVISIVRDRSQGDITYRITDEGRGFDWRRSICQSQDTGREDASGRGIFLVQAFFPTLSYNDLGNEVTFVVPLG
jgi:anti-sigma regulatory factor (Ser/Thr protein kinase)